MSVQQISSSNRRVPLFNPLSKKNYASSFPIVLSKYFNRLLVRVKNFTSAANNNPCQTIRPNQCKLYCLPDAPYELKRGHCTY